MGWTSSKTATRESVIREEVTRSYTNPNTGKTYTTRKSTIRGSQCWSIRDIADVAGNLIGSVICLVVFDRRDGELAWKTMTELGHPDYYDCPISYLNECQVSSDEAHHSASWRAEVRKRHTAKLAGAAIKSTLCAGTIITLPKNYKPSRFQLVEKVQRSWRATDMGSGRMSKLSPRTLSEAIGIERPTVFQTAPPRNPEAALRERWTAQGVSQDRQEELIAQIAAKAQPGTMVGPFQITL